MTPPGAQNEQAAVFRRRRFVAPHRQRRLWLRLLRPLAGALLIVGLPAAATVWAATSPVFRIDQMTVSSSGRISPTQAKDRLRSLRGRHILVLGLEDVERALGEQAWLRGVEISKRLPSQLEVRLLERRSVALLKSSRGLFFLDRQGEVIAPYDTVSGHGDFVIVVLEEHDSASIRGALDLVETWERVAGPWAHGLSEVEVVDAMSYRIHAVDLDFPLLVTGERLETGLRELRRHLPEIRLYCPTLEVADLRFSGQMVFQPAAAPPTEG